VNRQRHRRSRTRQRGITLIVGLVMLVLITLLVLATFHLSKSNLEIVGNVQYRNQALGATQQTIEAAIASPLLTTNPSAIFPTPCAANNTLCYDVNGDATDDVLVALTPQPACVKAEVIKTANLNLALEDDRRCTIQVGQSLGIENTSSSDSLCSDSLWDIVARSQDIGTDTKTIGVINQGVAVRVRTVDVATSCP
jgi:Tfp pilus assembly protein PilX